MRRTLLIPAMAGLGIVTTALFSSGCHKSLTATDTDVAQEETARPPDVETLVETRRTDGARTWAQNCMRCHNLRTPRARSHRQWEIIMHHMRVRANLTAEEHRLILAFLKSAN